MQPFGAYFDEHFKTAPAPVFASLFSKFPAARRVEQGAPAAAASAGRGTPALYTDFGMQRNAGADLGPQPSDAANRRASRGTTSSKTTR
mmetsp:Transcript_76923/g.213123  ORF Transcript_76923/g.213123 Transcript_76923/m.213123 type:complete len:89 (+) Transcript_76923:1452-1718(+)